MRLVEMNGIRKAFSGVEVLHGVDFSLEAGSVHALMGENGAGKSTLMRVLAGVLRRDAGQVKIEGKPCEIDSPAQARALGIAMIHQELSLVSEMTIAENIFLGREPRRLGLLDRKELYRRTEGLLSALGLSFSPRQKMKELRVADRQMVEIAKALSHEAKVIIMDEPTSAITDNEVDRLFGIIDGLKKGGAGIVYISHKMNEIFRIADFVTVLRDGGNVRSWRADEVDGDTLVRNMVGRELKSQFPKAEAAIGETVLEARALTRKGEYENISFELRRGEILGFAGLLGAGRTELMRSLFGLTQPDSGAILLKGRPVRLKSPRSAIEHGIAYVTEDRKGEGLVLPMSVKHNATLAGLKKFSAAGFLQGKREDEAVAGEVSSLSIKAHSPRLPVSSLSGGNQQKVVLAKWMLTNPEILILDEPTRGIDVGAKAEIYRIMCDYVAQGNAIIMVSSEMPEAMGMSDRIIVLSNHKYSGELRRGEFSQEALVKMQFQHM